MECIICSENIQSFGQIWACDKCHQVFHFSCAEDWHRTTGRNFACPTCRKSVAAAPAARCWCHKNKHNPDRRYNLANSCGERCDKSRICNGFTERPCEEVCREICHIGPCEPPICCLRCVSIKEPQAAVIDVSWRAKHEAWNSGSARAARADRRRLNRLRVRRVSFEDRDQVYPPDEESFLAENGRFFALISVWLLNFAMGIWANFNSSMWTEPLNWTDFTMNHQPSTILVGGVFSGVLVTANVVSWNYWAGKLYRFFRGLLRLDGPFSAIRKMLGKTILSMLLLALVLTTVAWFPMVLVTILLTSHISNNFDVQVVSEATFD